MIDWNHDGKVDYKDDAFFHNIVMKDSENKSTIKNQARNSNSSSSSGEISSGAVWCFVLFIVWLFSKLIGG